MACEQRTHVAGSQKQASAGLPSVVEAGGMRWEHTNVITVAHT